MFLLTDLNFQKVTIHNTTQITLNKALDIGSVVLVEALKSVDGKDAETTMQEYVKQEASANAAIANANAAAEEARTTAATTATNTVNAMKGQPNGIASLNAGGELEQAPPQSVMFLAAHPVGSLYETDIATNPGTLYGGTWAAWGGGKVTVGLNAADTSFNTVGKTGGEKTHTLTIAEMPSHTHDIKMRRNEAWDYTALSDYYGDPAGGTGFQMKIQMDMYVPYTGGGQAHNNLQPYITTYRWKRTT